MQTSREGREDLLTKSTLESFQISTVRRILAVLSFYFFTQVYYFTKAISCFLFGDFNL